MEGCGQSLSISDKIWHSLFNQDVFVQSPYEKIIDVLRSR